MDLNLLLSSFDSAFAQLHAGFAAIPTVPVKVALVTMCAIGAGGLSSEQKVSLHARKMLDGQDHAGRALFEESSTIRDAFHEHKFKAVGALLRIRSIITLRSGDCSSCQPRVCCLLDTQASCGPDQSPFRCAAAKPRCRSTSA